jgi:hypothetical protein
MNEWVDINITELLNMLHKHLYLNKHSEILFNFAFILLNNSMKSNRSNSKRTKINQLN